MIFCSTDLAAKVERAERDLLESGVRSVRGRVVESVSREIGGGLGVMTEPGSPLNKVCGLGFAPFEEERFAEWEEEHARRKMPMQVEIASLADPAVARWLTERGFLLVGVEAVLGRELGAAMEPRAGAGIEVRESGEAELRSWVALMTAGFAVPDEAGVASHESFDTTLLERILMDFSSTEGIRRFVALRDGVPAGAASLRAEGEIAQLCGAATLADHRRRGVQSALLEHRLKFAARCGGRLAIITTRPGSKSQENATRKGFELLYVRNILVKEF